MAGGSLLALLDDITTILDDVATMSKVAARKTAGVLGDDLALNAQQVTGLTADRELPVVWTVARGSLVNKVILVPAALAISAWIPWAVVPLLMIGGAFLCYEGFEKLAHRFLHGKEEIEHERAELRQAVADPVIDLVALERDKIKGAVRTDFILSAEIIVISLGTVTNAPFISQVGVLTAIALIMTVGVYGLVAGIVKLDDAGLYLSRAASSGARALGRGLLAMAPWLMKTLSVVGTAAMFLVGGGILMHGLPAAHHVEESFAHWLAGVPGVGGALAVIGPLLLSGLAGVVAGAIVLAVVTAVKWGMRTLRPATR
jgi:predicted DNA repair protein MutK